VVRVTADEVLGVLAQKELPADDRRRRLEEIAQHRFDVKTISQLILARHWRRFTPDQREEFVFEFKRYIAANYGDSLNDYDDEVVEVLGERPEARGDYTVRTRIIGDGFKPVAVDYRMRKKADRWQVIDVVIEGVSFLKSFRSQFQEILSQGKPEGLLRQLREKNDEAEGRSAGDDSAPSTSS
jgi:phospholipid transport system substrate-binding protein